MESEKNAPEGKPLLSVVIPVYNEERTISQIIKKVLDQPVDLEIIAVDDCSCDSTPRLLTELATQFPRLKVIRQEINQGKGAAIRTGIPVCKGRFVLIQDADLEYNPDEYIFLLEPLVSGKADVVFGSRFVTTRSRRVLYYWHSVANRILTALCNMLADVNLTDMETCYKVFRREVIQAIQIQESRFGFEPEITIKLARMGCRIFEVGISYAGRTYDEGKKISAKDGFRAVWCIIKYGLTVPHSKRPELDQYPEDVSIIQKMQKGR